MTDTKRKDVLENADAFERMVQNLCMVSMRSDVEKQLPHGLREAVDAEIRRPQWTARDLVEEIRALREAVRELDRGAAYMTDAVVAEPPTDVPVRYMGERVIIHRATFDALRALLPDTGEE